MTSLSQFHAQVPRLSSLEAAGLLEAVGATWPQVMLVPERFGAFLEAHLDGGPPMQRHVSDLYLVWAVLEGQDAAVRAFDQLLSAWVTLALERRPHIERDEVLSQLRSRMVVDQTLRQYAGHGALKAWVIVAALRGLTDVLRRNATSPQQLDALELAETLVDEGRNAESKLHVAALKPHLKEALEQGLAALPVRLRTVMRLHYVDGVSAESLGRMYGVHRATATRWLTDARGLVLETTHSHLATLVGPETLSSIKRELDHFELSLPGLFPEL